MHANMAEIVSEMRFDERARSVMERLARRAQHLLNNGRHRAGCGTLAAALQDLDLHPECEASGAAVGPAASGRV